MKCDCYDQKIRVCRTYSPATGEPIVSYDYSVGICNGTRELEECSCSGDMVRCDFYEGRKMRARALESAESRLKVAQDNLNASTGNEQTLQKKRNQVEICQYILDAVRAYK